MKAGGRKEAIREFKVSVGGFIPSVVLMGREVSWGHKASGAAEDSSLLLALIVFCNSN